MKRYEMIKDQNIFNRLITKGKYKKNNCFVIYKDHIEENLTNFGIAISKKYGKAVERNHIKRIVRNIIDKNRNLFQKNYNYIIMVRKSCQEAKFSTLEMALTELLK